MLRPVKEDWIKWRGKSSGRKQGNENDQRSIFFYGTVSHTNILCKDFLKKILLDTIKKSKLEGIKPLHLNVMSIYVKLKSMKQTAFVYFVFFLLGKYLDLNSAPLMLNCLFIKESIYLRHHQCTGSDAGTQYWKYTHQPTVECCNLHHLISKIYYISPLKKKSSKNYSTLINQFSQRIQNWHFAEHNSIVKRVGFRLRPKFIPWLCHLAAMCNYNVS